MGTTQPQTPEEPRPSGHDGRHRAPGPAAVPRWGRRSRVLGLVSLVVLVLAAAVAVAVASGRDNSALPNPLPSAADWLGSHPAGSPAGSPSVPGLASPSPKGPSSSGRPSRTPKPTGPAGVNIIDPGRANCAPRPSACGLPDATNTGVPGGTSLTVVNRNVTITKAGTVIDRQDIRGCVRVQAPGVTIRRSKITCADFYAVASFGDEYSGKGLVIEDSEVTCGGPGTGIGDTNFTVRRVNIHNCENGFDINGSVAVRDSYIHDLYQSASAHTDGVQLAGGAHITIEHNTIYDNDGTSAIISHPTDNSDVLVANNLMAGGAYTLYCPRDTSRSFRVIGNRIATLFYPKGGAFGPWTDCEKAAEVRGNVWDNSLRPL